MHDVIIVGAGTAGCVLADQLSRSGRGRVLLIEAGGMPSSPFVKIPAGFAKLFKGPLDWAYESEPQAAAGGRRIFTPRGKMLGGSANMNAMVHQWCHPDDFNGWVAAGATGWGWDEVAPVFRAQERWLGDHGGPSRGREGQMVVSPLREPSLLSQAFVQAARAAGLGDQRRYNGGAYAGAFISEVAQQGGRRFSAYDAYLKPALRRPNLDVLRDAHVVRVTIALGRASGVTVRRGAAEESYAAGRVVLAAGALGSPQVLMHSGVGAAAALSRFGITVRHDAPEVGENLQDHPLAAMVFPARGVGTLKDAESPLNLLRYLLMKRGMLTSNVAEAIAFTSVRGAAGSAPDAQFLFGPVEWRNEGLEPPQIHGFTLTTIVVAPRSRGRLALTSADPLAPPAIDFQLLSDPEGIDEAVMLAAMRLGRRIVCTPPLAAYAAELPSADATDDELRAIIAAQLQTVYHPTSTCRMGSDGGAVVDPQLQVRGVSGLWVADASVMPSVPRGHPNAVVAMIANRAAEMIEST